MSSENIKVFARVRPQFPRETAKGGKPCCETTDTSVSLPNPANGRMRTFNFDRVFAPRGESSDQQYVFKNTVAHMADEVLAGYNCTIFAYGQTGSGKTYTMQGAQGSRGLMPRLIHHLFDQIDNWDKKETEFFVQVSYVEIYGERLRDLLETSPVKRQNTRLTIRRRKNGIYIEGAQKPTVMSADDILRYIDCGARNRVISKTNMNAESSRSHGVVIIEVNSRDMVTDKQSSGKLMMVDLAGSETVKKTGATGQTLKEAQFINKGLTCLGIVMNKLTKGKSSHIPYRDSILTELLQDSLGGSCKTAMIICCSESSFNQAETLSTLRFGANSKKIKNKAKKNEIKTIAEYKKDILHLNEKIEKQKVIIKTLRADLGNALEGKIGDMSQLQSLLDRDSADEEFEAVKKEMTASIEEIEAVSHVRQLSADSVYSNASDSMGAHKRALSMESQGSTDVSSNGKASDSNPQGHVSNLSMTSLGSIGENEVAINTDTLQSLYDSIVGYEEMQQNLLALKNEIIHLRENASEKQQQYEQLELHLEDQSKHWIENGLKEKYAREAIERHNLALASKLSDAEKTIEKLMKKVTKMECKHESQILLVKKEKKESVQAFIEETREALENHPRLQQGMAGIFDSDEVRRLTNENAILQKALTDKSNGYIKEKLQAFEATAKLEKFQRKAMQQTEELKLLAELKTQGEKVLHERIYRLEKELRKQRAKTSNLNKKVAYLESVQDDGIADLMWKNPQTIKGKFKHIRKVIRPKKSKPKQDVLEQEIPQVNYLGGFSTPQPSMHGRVPSTAFQLPAFQGNPNYGMLQPNQFMFHQYHQPNMYPQEPYQQSQVNQFFNKELGDL